MAFRRRKIRTGQTLGGLIKGHRRKDKITLEQAEEDTKIRLKYLKAIEEDDWAKFSSRVYASGFVRRYCDYLGLPGKEIVEEYKVEFTRILSPVVSVGSRKKLEKFTITPKLLFSTFAISAVVFVIGYIAYSVNTLSQPPFINIIAPLEENVSQKDIAIEGKTLDTATLEVNGRAIPVDDSGYFNQKVELQEGLNVFEIKATSRLGKESTKLIKLYFENK